MVPLWNDLALGLRQLRKAPAFAVAAVLSLAIGIGANTAIFSAADALLLRPLPYPDAGRLVIIWQRSPGLDVPQDWLSTGQYLDIAAGIGTLRDVTAAIGASFNLTGDGPPERVDGVRVSSAFFPLFGARPLLGRGFTAEEDRPGAPPSAILAWGFWQRRFGGDPAIVGRTLTLNGTPVTIAGVLPRSFGFDKQVMPAVNAIQRADLFLPLPLPPSARQNRGGEDFNVFARLAPGTTLGEAQAQLDGLARRMQEQYPANYPPNGGLTLSAVPLLDQVVGDVRLALYVLLGAAGLVLLIACGNVANLLLSRAAAREKEMAIRTAVGAARARLIRQLLTESVVLALLGGGLGLGVAELGIRALIAIGPPGLPRMDAIRLDPPVFLFAALLTLLVGVLVGLLPGLGVLGREGGVGNRHTRATRGGLRSALVVSEVALAITLLVSAGLLFRSVRRVLSQEPGFDPSGVITMQVVEAGHEFDSTATRLQFFDQATAAVRQVPGVRSAGFTSQLPLSGEVDGYGYDARSVPTQKPGEAGSALRYAVTPGYFQTMGIPLVAGRLLDATDRPDAPRAVVINQSLARRLFGRKDPLGELMRFGPEIGDGPWARVVGVVGDVRHYSLAVDPPDAFYVVNGQWAWVDREETLVVRTGAGRAADMVPGLERAVWSVNPHVPILRVRTMESFVADSAGNRRFVLLALEALALAALVLAAVGLYGVVSGNVNERVREIGIRTALGATPGAVVGRVVGHAQALTLTGAGLGFAGAW
ncbi:MAG TPA: ABC transporter permease, partial [Gemmatimonadales bacterium]|nr:ABC transporter permease [Gemmatimonadales bacterium]